MSTEDRLCADGIESTDRFGSNVLSKIERLIRRIARVPRRARVYEEAIGSMPKGLKEGIGFVRIEAVDERMVLKEGMGFVPIEEEPNELKKKTNPAATRIE